MGTDNNTPTPKPKETSIWTIIGGVCIFFRIIYWLIHSYNMSSGGREPMEISPVLKISPVEQYQSTHPEKVLMYIDFSDSVTNVSHPVYYDINDSTDAFMVGRELNLLGVFQADKSPEVLVESSKKEIIIKFLVDSSMVDLIDNPLKTTYNTIVLDKPYKMLLCSPDFDTVIKEVK